MLYIVLEQQSCGTGQLGIWKMLNAEAETNKTAISLYFMKFVVLKCAVHQVKAIL